MSDREISSGHPPAGGEGHGAGSGGAVADNHEDVVDRVMDDAVSEANGAVEDDEESVELVSSDEPIELDEETFLQLKRNDPKLTELQIRIDTDSFAIDIDWDEEEDCLQRNTHLKKLDVWIMESSFEEEPHEVRARELLTSKVCRAIGQNQTIRNLCVAGDIDGHSFIDVEALQPFLESNDKLRRISLSECKLDRTQTRQIISSLKNRRNKGTLRCIDLGSNKFEDEYEDEFEEAFTEELMSVLAAGEYSNLTELEVMDRLGLGGFVQLSKFMTQPQCKLKKLWFRAWYEFGDDHMGILVNAIAGNKSLKEILFDGASLVSAQVWRSFSAAFVGSGIESLWFSRNRICPEKASIIGEMMSNSKTLRNLSVSLESMTDECWTSVFRALESPSLEELCISQCNVGEIGMADLGERMSKNASLRVLDAELMKDATPRVWQCFFHNIGDAGKLPLQKLDLRCSKVGNDGAVALSTAFASENSCLRTLILSSNNISCSGARALSAMLSNTTVLEHLDLDRNEIGDEGATAMSQACASSSTLKRLNLWCDQFTSNGRQSFVAVLQNPSTSLENLLLGGDAPSFEEIMAFLAILATNATLKELRFIYGGRDEQQIDERVLEVLRNTLCDKSSVRATFTSNHTLERLWWVGYSRPDDIEAYLSMNSDGNKFLVARQKILQTHFSGGDGWVRIFTDMQLALLPEAIHWMALDEVGHSPLFQLLQSLPALTDCHQANTKQASGTKRKLLGA